MKKPKTHIGFFKRLHLILQYDSKTSWFTCKQPLVDKYFDTNKILNDI